MANPEHEGKLKEGVKAWNEWRTTKRFIARLSGRNTGLREADLSGARLSGANLSGANLSEADLSGANLSEANLSEANLIRANLSEANLIRARLSGANLIRARLSGANLSEANLSGADLSEANLSGADLYGADLIRADLYRADLSEANLSGATYSHSTNWPAHFNPELSAATLSESFASPEEHGGGSTGEDFAITFSAELSPEQIATALSALADYYRACGGVGFRTDFELQMVGIREPVYAR
jgi:hypothetical protein